MIDGSNSGIGASVGGFGLRHADQPSLQSQGSELKMNVGHTFQNKHHHLFHQNMPPPPSPPPSTHLGLNSTSTNPQLATPSPTSTNNSTFFSPITPGSGRQHFSPTTPGSGRQHFSPITPTSLTTTSPANVVDNRAGTPVIPNSVNTQLPNISDYNIGSSMINNYNFNPVPILNDTAVPFPASTTPTPLSVSFNVAPVSASTSTPLPPISTSRTAPSLASTIPRNLSVVTQGLHDKNTLKIAAATAGQIYHNASSSSSMSSSYKKQPNNNQSSYANNTAPLVVTTHRQSAHLPSINTQIRSHSPMMSPPFGSHFQYHPSINSAASYSNSDAFIPVHPVQDISNLPSCSSTVHTSIPFNQYPPVSNYSHSQFVCPFTTSQQHHYKHHQPLSAPPSKFFFSKKEGSEANFFSSKVSGYTLGTSDILSPRPRPPFKKFEFEFQNQSYCGMDSLRSAPVTAPYIPSLNSITSTSSSLKRTTKLNDSLSALSIPLPPTAMNQGGRYFGGFMGLTTSGSSGGSSSKKLRIDPATTTSTTSSASTATASAVDSNSAKVTTIGGSGESLSTADSKGFPCQFADCKGHFQSRRGLNQHFAKKHQSSTLNEKQKKAPGLKSEVADDSSGSAGRKDETSIGNERYFPCTIEGCDKIVVSGQGLKQHLQKCHQVELGKRLYCNVEGCGKTFGRQPDLNRHIQSIHGRGQRYKCPHPDCSFSIVGRRDSLKQHEKRCPHLTH